MSSDSGSGRLLKTGPAAATEGRACMAGRCRGLARRGRVPRRALGVGSPSLALWTLDAGGREAAPFAAANFRLGRIRFDACSKAETSLGPKD